MAILPGQNYYNDPATGKSYPSGSGAYSGGDGSSVTAVYATEGALPGNPGLGTLAYVTGTHKLYIYVGGVWRRNETAFATF